MTYLGDGDNGSKGPLIPDETTDVRIWGQKRGTLRSLALWDRSTPYQLVGGVTAHQGDDGYPG